MPLIRIPPPQPTSSQDTTTTPHVKQQPTFAQCPRPNFVAGQSDWLHIISPRPFTDFDICPDCYNASIRSTRYGPCVAAAAPKPDEVSTRCDFSDLWSRIAYAWLFTQNAPDLTLLGGVSEIQQDADGTCPNLNLEDPDVAKGGKAAVTRSWYCLYDPSTNGLVEDMTVCSDCIAHINFLFPCLSGIFRPVADGQKLLATCDLMSIGDGQARFLEYIDRIIEVAEKTLSNSGPRDVSPLITYIRKWAAVPFCPKYNTASAVKNYSMPSLVPEFTACEECYLKHIHPLHEKSPAPRILSQIQAENIKPGHGFSCDLYSPRLQQYFEEACETNDLSGFRQKIQARNVKLQETKTQLARMRQEAEQLKMQAEMHMNMMQIEQANAMATSLAWTTSGWHAPPIDWSASNAQMTQGSQSGMQSAMILDKMKLLENEWAEYWE